VETESFSWRRFIHADREIPAYGSRTRKRWDSIRMKVGIEIRCDEMQMLPCVFVI